MGGKYKHMETRLIHAGEPDPPIHGAVSMPVFQSSTFRYTGKGGYHDLRYIRLNNTPNHEAVHSKLASLENGEAALVTASGMAAISTTLLTVLRAGDHLLAQDCLYGGTHDLLTTELPDLGITFDFVDGADPAGWQKALRPETRAIYMETITNPLLQVADLEAAAEFAAKHDLIAVIDNTFATPVNFRPLEHGFDLSIHSCTKYLNGHSDIVAGAVIGRADLVRDITHKLNHLGGSLDPHACSLLHRGLKTLAVRVKQQNQSASLIAAHLQSHPKVRTVHYPGLESSPGYQRAAQLLDGFGGMLSFELDGTVEQADAFISALAIPISAPSLGGVESLITRPATTSHSGLSPEELAAMGIPESLIRLSVGLEHPEDLIDDLEQGFLAMDRV
ncbi:MAG: trans-sulfuration enzyme family protein [Desulfobacteraceae bacterium]